MSNKRCRLRLSISSNIESYNDNITEPKLIEYINVFLKKFKIIGEVTFQCSYLCDVFDNSYEKLETKFSQIVNDKIFYYTIDGFAQINEINSNFAHKHVLKIISGMKRKFLGIGGESLIYGIAGGFINFNVYTNSEGVHKDNLLNGGTLCHLVNYSDFKMIDVTEPTVCVANVSRNGIRKELCTKLDQLYIRDIIGVYCSDVFNNDLKFLKNYYLEQLETNGFLYIVHFKRIPIISLGNNCCIAYQLQQHKLRDARYPFDWVRYKKVDQLIACLENKCSGFVDVVNKKKPTGIFPIIYDDFPSDEFEVSEEIFINKYEMLFPHDKLENLHKYSSRIERMFILPKVDYLIDCIVSDEQMNKLKSLLPNARKIIVLTNKKGGTWKKEHLDWKKVFNV